MTTRNNRRDSIVQEREEAESVAFDASRLPRLAEDPARIDHAARFREQLNKEEPTPEPEPEPTFDVPAPRVIAPIDLSDFRALMDAAKVARERSAGYQQALQQAQVAEVKAQGALEGEYARLRRRYGIGEGEDFDPETGAIVVVQQG